MIVPEPFAMLPLTLAQTGVAVADTVVTIAASPTGLQRWVDVLTSIASIVIALALIAIAIPLIPAAWNSRKMYARINKNIERFQGDVRPIVRNASDVMDNLNYISASIRTDVEQFKGTIDSAQTRLTAAAEVAEQRINELNALLGVVQEEAERIFIDTASTIRGVKVGASALQRPDDAEWQSEEGPARPAPRPRRG